MPSTPSPPTSPSRSSSSSSPPPAKVARQNAASPLKRRKKENSNAASQQQQQQQQQQPSLLPSALASSQSLLSMPLPVPLQMPIQFPLSSYATDPVNFDYTLLNNMLTEPVLLSPADFAAAANGHVSHPATVAALSPMLVTGEHQSSPFFTGDHSPQVAAMRDRSSTSVSQRQQAPGPQQQLDRRSSTHVKSEHATPLLSDAPMLSGQRYDHEPHRQDLHQGQLATLGGAGVHASTLAARLPPRSAPHVAYDSVTAPYNYTESFHHLVSWVKERMDKPDILRICRALASFRPSFMALILNLTEEDLVFMEKCFQRTLLEYEKLIVYSGTPTVVWRRTGEIALVGKEFCLLTGWSRDRIGAGGANNVPLGPGPNGAATSSWLYGMDASKKTYIYELMDAQSALSYWEHFSAIAFDNSQSSVVSTCVLVTPQGRSIPCAFCFTIKKDIFDIPLAVVGNFLPILS
ncbi:Transcriptional regulator of nonfermentable carbon utilization [Sorochytrium milnesiophthora]